ncbi:MAG: ABC transporter substrate-binding protein [Paucibacter sp.]|nr:ABC transporter substrate-binding protein [Roseateles sp.]
MFKLFCALILLVPFSAGAAELRVAVDASTEMPWAHIYQDQLQGGIQRDLGLAIGDRMGREVRFVVLPRQRLSRSIEQGEVDLACVLTPEWLPGPFDWTPRFIDDADVVLSLSSVPAPKRVEDLANVPLGTVNGFRYPVLEQQLGGRFIRDDAPSATNNLRKLDYGRISHAVANERFVTYQRHLGQLKAALNPPLVISRHRTGCAISRQGQITAPEVSAVIEQLQRSGALAQILARYR